MAKLRIDLQLSFTRMKFGASMIANKADGFNWCSSCRPSICFRQLQKLTRCNGSRKWLNPFLIGLTHYLTYAQIRSPERYKPATRQGRRSGTGTLMAMDKQSES